MTTANRQRLTAGLVLILLGLGFFLLQRVEGVGDEVVLLIIGTAFLVAYFYQRVYGLLIPAGILMGLGVGEVLEDAFWWADQGTQLGLGLGFVAIYVIARLYQGVSHWWPLIPGGILILVGLPRTWRIFSYLFENWPLILVIIGVVILLGALRRSGAGPEPATPADESVPDEPSSADEPVEPKVE